MKKYTMQTILAVILGLVITVSMCAAVTASDVDRVVTASDDETTTTSTVVACYATQLEYDASPMAVGETRAIRFYHPETQTASGAWIDEASSNISFTYEDGSDTVYITALAAGDVKLYICENNCAFGAYVDITVHDETTTTSTVAACYATQLEYDASPMAVGETRAIRFYHPETQTASGAWIDEASSNISFTYEDGSDTVYITALAAGDVKLYICENNCAFGAYVHITVHDGTQRVGDVDGDGAIDMRDVMTMFAAVSKGRVIGEERAPAADYDNNGVLDIRDVMSLYKRLSVG